MIRGSCRNAFLVLIASLALAPGLVLGQGPLQRMAQFIIGPPQQPPAHVVNQQQPATMPVTDQPRSSEIAIELAWLSDPMTFPYALSARVSGNGVQVQGFVPSESIRQRALFLAKKNTNLQVFDGTRVHPGLAAPRATSTPNLTAIANDALRNALPQHAGNLRVQAGNNGSVTVTGTVSSMDEKLTISQALRQVSGCTSVANSVHVSGANYGMRGNPQNQRGPFGGPPLLRNAMALIGFGQTDNRNQGNARNFDSSPGQPGNTHDAQQPNNASAPSEYTSPYHSASRTTETASETNWRTSPPSTAEPATPVNHTMPVIATTPHNNPPREPVQYEQPSASDNTPPVIASSQASAHPVEANPYVRQKNEPPLFGGAEPDHLQIAQEPAPTPTPVPVTDAKRGPKLPTQQLRQRVEATCAGSVRNVAVEYDKAGKLVVRAQLVNPAYEKQIIDRIINMPELLPYQEQLQLSLELPAPANQNQIIQESQRR